MMITLTNPSTPRCCMSMSPQKTWEKKQKTPETVNNILISQGTDQTEMGSGNRD